MTEEIKQQGDKKQTPRTLIFYVVKCAMCVNRNPQGVSKNSSHARGEVPACRRRGGSATCKTCDGAAFEKAKKGNISVPPLLFSYQRLPLLSNTHLSRPARHDFYPCYVRPFAMCILGREICYHKFPHSPRRLPPSWLPSTDVSTSEASFIIRSSDVASSCSLATLTSTERGDT